MAGGLLLGFPAANNSRVIINVPPAGYMNIAKSCNFVFPAGTALDANGYPVNAVGAVSNPSMVPNYYGQYVMSWGGKGTLQFTALSAIIYSGGPAVASLITVAGGPAGSGYANGNFAVTTAVVGPRVVFKFGTLVTGVSGGSGSLVTITHENINFSTGFSTGTKLSFAVGCSSNLVNGPNTDGSWTITNVSGTSCTLNGSTGVVSPTVTGSGGVGTMTEAIQQVAGCTFGYVNFGTFASFTNLVVCKIANETDVNNGLIYDPLLISQLQQLKGTPGGVGRNGDFWLRFMDVSGVQGSFECDFSQRITASSQCWTASYPVNAYAAGAITNGGASGAFTDLYSCAGNPTNSPASGPPIDCEIIQGTTNATSTGGYPGLTVAGRSGFGNWPIVDATTVQYILISAGAASAGLNCVFTFAASWLNGNVPYVFTYTTVSGDTNRSTFGVNLVNALIADAVLKAGKIVFSDDDSDHLISFYLPTALSGVFAVTSYTGPAQLTTSSIAISSIGAGQKTFIFNALLGGFMRTSLVQSLPCEAIVELCNRVGANCWYNWPILTKAQYITDFTNFIADGATGLTSGLKLGTEVGNEMWNFGAAPYGRAICYGIALGLFSFPYGGDAGPYSWQALRTIQYATLSRAAWAGKGRVAGQHYVLLMSAEFDVSVSGNFDLICLKGQFLVTTNSNFANFGGIGGTAAGGSFNVAGSQPADTADAIGCAPYWGSLWFNYSANGTSDTTFDAAQGVTGTVVENTPMLQAALDYGNGLPATSFTSLFNQFAGITPRSSGGSGAIPLTVKSFAYSAVFANEEAQAAQFDSRRSGAGKKALAILHYEGGDQWGMGASFNNGVNSQDSLASSLLTADITNLANKITALSWNVSSFTVSGTNDATEMATMILQMGQGWKYDTDKNAVAVNTGSYKTMIKTYYYQALFNISGANREVHGCQYGYAGGQWGILWSAFNQVQPPYKNFDAIAEYNA